MYAPVVPSKTIPDSRPKWAKCIPVFRPKRPKNPTLWAASTYMFYIEELPPGSKAVYCDYTLSSLNSIVWNLQERFKLLPV